MGIVRKLMIRLLGTRSQRIHLEFANVVVRTTKELEKADELLRDLLISWFVSLPWAYFETLFISEKSWNGPLLAVLDNAQVIDGEDCALISQAFCLWHLEQIIRNDDNYKHYSMKEIEQWITRQITKGILLTEKLETFRKVLQGLAPDDWYYEYVGEIVNTLYTDLARRLSIMNGLRLDPRVGLAIMTHSTEMMATTKQTVRGKGGSHDQANN